MDKKFLIPLIVTSVVSTGFFIAIFSQFAESSTTITIFANQTGMGAYNGTVNAPHTLGLGIGTNLTAKGYTLVGANDGLRLSTLGGSFQDAYNKFNYTIPAYATLNSLNMTWEGYTDLGDIDFYLWNYTSGAWKLITTLSDPDETDANITYNITTASQKADFISGNLISVLVENPTWTRDIITDFFMIKISYESSEDSCTYSGSGNFVVKGSDWCDITTNYDLGGNKFICSDAGKITVDANIKSVKETDIAVGCQLAIAVGKSVG